MVRPKKSHTKKQKGSIDFKKIRHKVGRKLPPPKSSTNTQIKSKAIILPEQSVLSERCGLAVSSKNLTLRELLQQSSHHNAKTRKFALLGIKDLLQKNPSEVKIHKHVIVEKLRVHICDTDKVVRETLYHLLKIYIFPASKEDSSIISLMMAYVFNAMTHLALDIRVSAFNFFDLIVTCYPSSFFTNAEKIIDNYRDILQNTQVYIENRSKIKIVIRGLAHCLCLLLPEKGKAIESHEQEVMKTSLHAYEHDTAKKDNSISSIIGKLQELLPILVHCFQEFAPLNNSVSVSDTMSFECTLSILECIKLAVCILASEIDQPHTYFGELASHKPSQSDGLKDTLLVLEKLWQCFPIRPINESTEKDEERYFSLNTRITEICLHVVNGMHQAKILKEKFLKFMENCLHGQNFGDSQAKRSLQDKHLTPVLPLIPGMLIYLNGNWRVRLLQAFTLTFQDCKVESRLNLTCLSVVETMLLSSPEKMLLLDSFGVDALDYQTSWIQKLLGSLIQAEERNSSLSKAILRLVLKIGQRSLQNPSFEYHYNNSQTVLREFYCTISDDGNINYGPFVKLPKDCQELALCCLYYFSNLDSRLLQSLTYCSLYEGIEQAILLRMIDVLQSSYKAGNVDIAVYVSFLLTLVARFKVHRGISFSAEDHVQFSRRRAFKSITEAVCSCLSAVGDSFLVLMILQNRVLDEMKRVPSWDNMYGILRIICVLDSSLSTFSQNNFIILSLFIFNYVIDIATEVPDIYSNQNYEYYIKPCLLLFCGSCKLMTGLFQHISSIIKRNSSVEEQLDFPTQVNSVAVVLIILLKHCSILENASVKGAIKDILKHMHELSYSNTINLTIEDKHKIRSAFDSVIEQAFKENFFEVADIEGM